ncbi:MAG: hypothetical protein EPO22_06025 [Dehalococcoidia bacterium]|nr:MAG: hypothetical protein EPO22_06025 [Dehalococcoidia bacterium]
MPRKTSKQSNAAGPAKQSRPYAELGWWLAVVVVAIVAGAAAFFIVRSRGGDSSPSSRSAAELDIPSPVAPEPASRSSAADLLAGKKWDEMTAEERDLVKGEVARAYENAAFRATSDGLAVDVYRIDGHTRVVRQFRSGVPPHPDDTVQTLVFYCDSADGNLDAFSYTIAPGDVRSDDSSLKARTQPYDGLVAGLDWSQATDLGFRTIAGHRTHGFAMPYTPPAGTTPIDSKTWFDVDSARIIEREQEGSATYTFDWSVPAPVEIPAGEPVASCADVFYASVPSARPAEGAPAATATASATP